MCGIVGGVTDAQFDEKSLLSTLGHRGPDSEGAVRLNNLFLGHTRLSIIDLSEQGAQPMSSKDGNFIIVFNGEVYNHLDLRNELTEYSFKSTSDTETVLYSFIKYGEKCLNKFNGIFAFAVFNKSTNDLFIARDQLGVKPLYYSDSSNNFVFSSEIKSLNQLGINNTIDTNALKNYLTFMWSPGELTPYKSVKKLKPGHYITVNTQNLPTLQIKKYYQLPFTGNYQQKTETQWIDKVEEVLYNAVKKQMMSDVPVGFFLSGGLDSSLLVAMAKKHFPMQDLQCYTIDVGEHSSSGFVQDIDYAKKVAKQLNVNLEITKAKLDVENDFDKMIYHLDEPQADAAPLNVLNICRLAKKQGIKVLIGGTAGDDIFSGYRRHQSLKLEGLYSVLPQFSKNFLQSIGGVIPTKNYNLYRLKKLLLQSGKSQQDRFNGYFNVQSPQVANALFYPSIQKKTSNFDPNQYFYSLLKEIPKELSPLNKLLYMEIYSFLSDHNLNYTDKMGMAEGVEIRVPYLDKELVELSTKIPPQLKMNGTTTKYILKKVAERYLSKEVIYRPKTGFGAPIDRWIKHDLKPMVKKRLSNEWLNSQQLFDSNKVQQLINDNDMGKVRGSYPIWSLLAIQSWLSQFEHKI